MTELDQKQSGEKAAGPGIRHSSVRARGVRIVVLILAAAALSYLLLLIPEPKPPVFKGAGKQPFSWNQNLFWAELEQEFIKARAAGCEALAGRVDAAVNDLKRLLADISAKPLPPDEPAFSLLETNLFRLAPIIAACPQRLDDYSALVGRLRSEVKRQSAHWDLEALSSRQRMYRLLAGSRMALEEATLQAPMNSLGNVIVGDDEPSQTPPTEILGLRIHSGDILVSRGGAPTSALIARGNDYPGSFSHVALVYVDSKTGAASLIESHIECGVAIASLGKYLEDKKLRIMVLRLRSDLPALQANPLLPHQAAARALQEAKERHIPYDFSMNYRDHSARFCSEVVSTAYDQAGIHLWMGVSFISSQTVATWLGSLGARYFETQEPSDLEYDPQLRVVAEWRDGAELFRAHIDDAVTDVMLEEAKPDEALDYNLFLLPITRLVKAYSLLLNKAGKIGPVPEGMSATTALRVKKYRRDHAAIAARVAGLAAEFKSAKSYTPPYWELFRLAREAKHQIEQKG